jgi:hypothetical protein
MPDVYTRGSAAPGGRLVIVSSGCLCPAANRVLLEWLAASKLQHSVAPEFQSRPTNIQEQSGLLDRRGPAGLGLKALGRSSGVGCTALGSRAAASAEVEP